MNDNPSKETFRQMVAACDDNRGDHIIWVGKDGEVHITCTADEREPSDDELKYRYERLLRGNGYVGPDAAKDDEWMQDIWENGIVRDWQADATGYMDY